MKHLKDNDEGYWEHGIKALAFSMKLLGLSIICFVHAFIPCCFTKTASNRLKQLLKEMNRMN